MAAAQKDLFDDYAPVLATPSPAAIRERLEALLACARNAHRMPWSAERTRVNAHLFHNMANWLPVAEREALRAAFARELKRLRAADDS